MHIYDCILNQTPKSQTQQSEHSPPTVLFYDHLLCRSVGNSFCARELRAREWLSVSLRHLFKVCPMHMLRVANNKRAAFVALKFICRGNERIQSNQEHEALSRQISGSTRYGAAGVTQQQQQQQQQQQHVTLHFQHLGAKYLRIQLLTDRWNEIERHRLKSSR